MYKRNDNVWFYIKMWGEWVKKIGIFCEAECKDYLQYYFQWYL